MTRLLKLPSASFTTPNLPVARSWPDQIRALPGLRGWFNGLSDTVLLDGDDRLLKWLDRGGGDTVFVKNGGISGAPLWVEDAYNDRPAMRFTNAHNDSLAWSGQRNVVAGLKQSTIAVVGLPNAQTANVQILSDVSPSTGWNTLYVSTGNGINLTVGNNGAASLGTVVTSLVGTGVPMLIIATVDDAANQLKLGINNVAPTSTTNAGVVVEAADAYIGAGRPDPSTSADTGIDMDLFDLIMLEIDILAPANAAYLAAVKGYVSAAYGFI